MQLVIAILEEKTGRKIPKCIHRIARLAASTPLLVEIAKCADNWFGHLVSDMGGSSKTQGAGMGIPGVFISLLYEVASLPGLKNSGLPEIINNLYQNKNIDMRYELTVLKEASKQAVPVLFTEVFTRVLYFVYELGKQAKSIAQQGGTYKDIDWERVIPFNNRSVDRMLTVSSMTFTVADTADAAVHAAIESQGNEVLFAGKFVARMNYLGAGRAAYALVKEISYEKKEADLLHKKLLLTRIETQEMVQRLEEYQRWLEESVAAYLAEDINDYLSGFDEIQRGMQENDSDLIIKGNVTIQKVLGRDPQFTNQQEFDELMGSEDDFVL